jgi:hypothetical protein
MTLRELREELERMEKEYGGEVIVKTEYMKRGLPVRTDIEDIWLDPNDVLHIGYKR